MPFITDSGKCSCQFPNQRVQASHQLIQESTSLAQHTAQLTEIQEQLGQIFAGAPRGPVASLNSVASFALRIGSSPKEAWNELCRELHSNGITAEMLKEKKEEIFKLCRRASVPNNTKSDEAVKGPEMKQKATKTARTPLGDVVGLLLQPARNFRAGLAVKRLVSKSDLDAKNTAGETALHVAASQGRTDLVKVLLEKGAAIDPVTSKNWTALHVAAANGHLEVVKVPS